MDTKEAIEFLREKEKCEELRRLWFSWRDEAAEELAELAELRERIAKMQDAIDDAYIFAEDGEASTAARCLYKFVRDAYRR